MSQSDTPAQKVSFFNEVYLDLKVFLSQFYADFPTLCAIIIALTAVLTLRQIFSIKTSDFVKGIIREFFRCFERSANKIEVLDFILLVLIFFSWLMLIGLDPLAKWIGLVKDGNEGKDIANMIFSAFIIAISYLSAYGSIRLCSLKE